ncbi:hypothetical protein ALC53_13753 [Atta colombica]|uniref:Uncharacterized protein n=1 Tax=Atta colombica TaxID=520822 RepID=A0A195AUJ5_9HYME|nr:hypothetical protein ALC53_13753 [Atta colombica]
MGKLKRIPKPFIKIKRLSRKRKVIPLDQEIKKHVRWKGKREMHAKLEATINFETLKITADPQVDVDYIKSMSIMSIYDRNYRSPLQENIFEDSMYIRSDMTHELNNLSIIDESEDDCIVNAPQRNIGSDILQKTSFLYISDNIYVLFMIEMLRGNSMRQNRLYSKVIIEVSRFGLKPYCAIVIKYRKKACLTKLGVESAQLILRANCTQQISALGNERPVEAKAGSAWMPAAWYTCVDASEVTVHAGVAGGVGQSVTQSHSQLASRSRLRGAIAWAFCFFSSSLFPLFFFYFLIPIFCAVFQLEEDSARPFEEFEERELTLTRSALYMKLCI